MVRNIANFSHQSLLLCLLLVLLPSAAQAQVAKITPLGFDAIRLMALLFIGIFNSLIPFIILCRLRSRPEKWPEWVNLAALTFCITFIAILPLILEIARTISLHIPQEFHRLPIIYGVAIEGAVLIFTPYFTHKYLKQRLPNLNGKAHALTVSASAVLIIYAMIRIVELHAGFIIRSGIQL